MKLLERKNWVVCLFLTILLLGFFPFVLAFQLHLYDEDAWYTNWRYWFFASLCFVFPVFILLFVFMVQMTSKVASTLKVPGKEIYATPYSWILCIVVPVVGWVLLIVMYLFIILWTIVMLAKGEGESYISDAN